MVELTTKAYEERSRKWFGLGQLIESNTIEGTLSEAGMNWTISKRPVVTTSYIPPEFLKNPNTNPKPLTVNGTERIGNLRYHLARLLQNPDDKNIQDELKVILDETEATYLPHTNEFAIVRNDTNVPFGVMGRIYGCLNNDECLSIIQPLLDEERVTVERAGEFNHGANCWVLVKFPNSITVGTDELDQYMKISWSHDGTEKLSATFIALLRRTNTQINPKLPGSHVSIEIRHTTNAPERIELARQLLAKGETYFHKLEETLGELISMPMTDEQMEEYLEALIPDSKNPTPDPKSGEVKITRASKSREEVMGIFQKTSDSVAQTRYAAFGAVASWCDHDKLVRVTGQDKAENDDQLERMGRETRLKGIWMKSGSARKMKDDAFNLIIK